MAGPVPVLPGAVSLFPGAVDSASGLGAVLVGAALDGAALVGAVLGVAIGDVCGSALRTTLWNRAVPDAPGVGSAAAGAGAGSCDSRLRDAAGPGVAEASDPAAAATATAFGGSAGADVEEPPRKANRIITTYTDISAMAARPIFLARWSRRPDGSTKTGSLGAADGPWTGVSVKAGIGDQR